MRLRRAFAVALVALVTQAVGAQQAPRGVRIAGTVKSVATDHVILATAKGDVDIAITPHTRVLVRHAASARDIKPGVYLGTSNQNATKPDTGTATEVHLMANGPNLNFPMNSSGLTMTNGHVKAVTPTANGEEMSIDYGKATVRHVFVTADTRITRMVNASAAALKQGVKVNAVTRTGTDGKPTATFIVVNAPAAGSSP